MLDGDEARLALPAVPKAAGLARAFVREHLSAPANDTPVDDPTVDAIALCVSELVTNALDHAVPPFGLRLARRSACLRIEVSDATTAPPVRRVVEPTALRGRGLQFVEQSARSWGVSATSDGKTVWAEFGLVG